MPNTSFAAGVQGWVGELGLLRGVVRQHVVAAQLAVIVGHTRPLRVLDVGCGQGTQALLLARNGHDVTGLDVSAELLGHFEQALAGEPAEVQARVRLVQGPGEAAVDLVPGPFDLVLCHGVLMYLDDIGPMLAALSAVAGEHAGLSLLVRNGLALAMRDGLRGDYPAALSAFGTLEYTNRLGLTAHAHTPDIIDRALASFNWQRQRWYGVRVFTDHCDEPAPAAAELTDLLAAEIEAGTRDPYRQVAAIAHLYYIRDASGRPDE
ncbi:MAG TPA: methyltransferase domain-containing protein [Pseudonocardiaceae bacterium]|nr:methyltransferase domain-containing protein [Pseudonocardiaceae bacterium]